eukprot:15357551-Ditylum_brightwellii.AAC.1
MPPSSTTSLAELIYRKTGGNGLIATQFIQTLWWEGSLYFMLDNNSWAWDLKAIEAKSIPDDAVQLLLEKILQLPSAARCILQYLSCIGSSCHESILVLIISQGFPSKCFPVLDLIIEEGLLNKEGAKYKFAHDQIQLAAYSLIPPDKRDCVHLQIGSMILKHASEEKLGSVIFIAADQLNRGTKFITDEDQKLQLAKLNLRAGEKAMSLGTFWSAVTYLKSGIDLLNNDSWTNMYDLSLQLHSSYAESLYSI